MASDPCLGMLGLARRAGKLAYGDELVRQLCADHKARCVLVAADAGESTAKKAALYAARANVPCITLPYGKDELGAAIGKNGCAVCAVSDIGMAAAAMAKLAVQYPQYAQDAAQIGEKNARIQSRRGKKKPRDRDAQPKAAQPSGQPPRDGKRPPRAGAGSRPGASRSATANARTERAAISLRSVNRAKIHAQSAYQIENPRAAKQSGDFHRMHQLCRRMRYQSGAKFRVSELCAASDAAACNAVRPSRSKLYVLIEISIRRSCPWQ